RPCSMPFRAQESAVTWAANGVDFRDPLKPADPADSQTITLPSRSVSVTIVLLNDVLMCACPMAMFFRTRRRVRPRVAWRRGGAISGHLRCHARSAAAKTKPGKDAGSARSRRLRARPRTPQVALDLEVRVDVVAQLRHFLVGQVLHLRVQRQPEVRTDLLRGGAADPVDVGQPYLEPLLVRKVHSGDTCHVRLLALALLVTGIAADDHGLAVPLDHATPLTHRLDGPPDPSP